MMKAETFEAIGGYDSTYKYAQDYDMLFRVYSRGSRMGQSSVPLYHRKLSGSQLTTKFRAQQLSFGASVKKKWRKALLNNSGYGALVKV